MQSKNKIIILLQAKNKIIILLQAKNKIIMLRVLKELKGKTAFRPIAEENEKPEVAPDKKVNIVPRPRKLHVGHGHWVRGQGCRQCCPPGRGKTREGGGGK